jgi:hypothetical protein
MVMMSPNTGAYPQLYPSQPYLAAPPLTGPGSTAAMAPEIAMALNRLVAIRNNPQDEAYLQSLGVHLRFHNGQQALNLIQSRNSPVVFGDMGDSKAFAQWINDDNTIMVNQKYKGSTDPDVLNAIACAIYHEAGHIGSDSSSLQEETDCLALNTLGYMALNPQDPLGYNIHTNNRLIYDGVALYPKLFFDPDPSKKALVNREVTKYGDLPLCSDRHPEPVLPNGGMPVAMKTFDTVRIRDAQSALQQMTPATSPEAAQKDAQALQAAQNDMAQMVFPTSQPAPGGAFNRVA